MFGFLGRSRQSSHRFCQDNLSAFLDGQLSERDRERVRQHLEQCQDCQWNQRTLARTVRALRSLPQVKAPRSFRIPRSAPAPSIPIWFRPWVYGALRTATAAVATVLVVSLAGNALALPPVQPPAGIRVKSTVVVEAPAAPRLAPGQATAAGPTAPAVQPTVAADAQRGTATARGEQAKATPAAKAVPTRPVDALGNDTPAPAPQGTPVSGLGGGAAQEGLAATMTAAPKGMGGPVATPAPGVAALAAATAPTAAAGGPQAQATPERPSQNTETLSSTGEAEPGRVSGQRALRPVALLPVRQRMGGYPWHLWAIGAGASLAVLLGLTLWLGVARARWF